MRSCPSHPNGILIWSFSADGRKEYDRCQCKPYFVFDLENELGGVKAWVDGVETWASDAEGAAEQHVERDWEWPSHVGEFSMEVLVQGPDGLYHFDVEATLETTFTAHGM